jgi:arylsulfatase
MTKHRAEVAALLLLLAVSACGRSAPPPNLVFVTLDTTRADHLGLYGYFRDTSPALDAFGEHSIVFERAVMPMATTLPTHLSLFTSTQPLEHGVLYNTVFGAAPFAPTPALRALADFASQAGWHTAAFISAAPLKRGTGIEHGFQTFDQPEDPRRPGEDTTRAAVAWLSRQAPGTPFLLWVHYFDAHWPYAPPGAYFTMFSDDAALEAALSARQVPRTVVRPLAPGRDGSEATRVSANLYDGELRYQDDQLAKLLATLTARPDWERTAVVIAGDHGEGLGQHGEAAHGGTWNEQLQVPLLMRIPGEPPRRVTTLVTAVDVIPTLLGRLRVPALDPILAQASGRDVLATGGTSLPVVSRDTGREGYSKERHTTLTTERWKLFRIEGEDGKRRHLLFDLEADPFELNDVASQQPERTAELDGVLESALAAQRSKGVALRGSTPRPLASPDPNLVEQLEALGYATGKEAPP